MPDNKTKRKSRKSDGSNALPPGLLKIAEEAAFLEKEAAEALLFEPPKRLGVLPGEPELELGQRLQHAREAKKLTQGQLAELTKRADKDGKGLSRTVVSLYELGTNRPGPREMRMLCEVLQITPSYLIYGDDEPFENFLNRYRHGAARPSEPESFAAITYCFTRLHPHHRIAVMELMLGLLRGWHKGFDDEMDKDANKTFLGIAEQLTQLLTDREKAQKTK
jgi:transcriptional regulator with XRE-family HTH domain